MASPAELLLRKMTPIALYTATYGQHPTTIVCLRDQLPFPTLFVEGPESWIDIFEQIKEWRAEVGLLIYETWMLRRDAPRWAWDACLDGRRLETLPENLRLPMLTLYAEDNQAHWAFAEWEIQARSKSGLSLSASGTSETHQPFEVLHFGFIPISR